MVLTANRRLAISLLVVYMLLLIASGVLINFVGGPALRQALPNPYVQALLGWGWSILIRIVLPVLYIIHLNRANPFDYLKLTKQIRKGLLWALTGGLVFGAGISYRHFSLGHPIHLPTGNIWYNLILTVGFMEEIPLRGLVFQKLNEYLRFWPATVLSSLVFMVMHFPAWIAQGQPFAYFLTTGFYVLVFAGIMCVILKRSGSLWGCIIIHSMNDFISVLW
jgi:membrane protease YdiL (CAAX protease family)